MSLSIHIDDDQRAFQPGDTLAGTVEWQLDEDPGHLEINLVWFTDGKGERDVGDIASERWEHPGRSGREAFRFELPDGPWSFSGRLVTLSWALELVVYPSRDLVREEIVLSPTGDEITLGNGTAE